MNFHRWLAMQDTGWTDDDSDVGDWLDDETLSCKCLFCSSMFEDVERCLVHIAAQHEFDLLEYSRKVYVLWRIILTVCSQCRLFFYSSVLCSLGWTSSESSSVSILFAKLWHVDVIQSHFSATDQQFSLTMHSCNLTCHMMDCSLATSASATLAAVACCHPLLKASPMIATAAYCFAEEALIAWYRRILHTRAWTTCGLKTRA